MAHFRHFATLALSRVVARPGAVSLIGNVFRLKGPLMVAPIDPRSEAFVLLALSKAWDGPRSSDVPTRMLLEAIALAVLSLAPEAPPTPADAPLTPRKARAGKLSADAAVSPEAVA